MSCIHTWSTENLYHVASFILNRRLYIGSSDFWTLGIDKQGYMW